MTSPTPEITLGTSSSMRSAPMGHALWRYTAEGWRLKKDASVPGARPGQPPTGPGLFVGQIRSTPSEAVTQVVS